MDIQDLPIEVLKLLLYHAATSVGAQSAFRLRLISRLFANEMTEAIFQSGVIDTDTYCMGLDEVLTVQTCRDETLRASYLFSRLKKPLSDQSRKLAPAFEFLDHLRLIATEFISTSGGKHDYNTVLKKVCDLVVQNYDFSEPLIFGLDGRSARDSGYEDCTPALAYVLDGRSARDPEFSVRRACLTLACGFGDLNHVQRLLQDGYRIEDRPGNENDHNECHAIKVNPVTWKSGDRWDRPHFLSFPIRAAVRGGHKDVVEFLLQCGSQLELGCSDSIEPEWTIINDAALHHEPSMLASLLQKRLKFPSRELWAEVQKGAANPSRRGYAETDEPVHLAYVDACITAAYTDDHTALDLLLDNGPIQAPLPLQLFRYILLAACEGGSLSIAQAIFEMSPSLYPGYEADLVDYHHDRRTLWPSIRRLTPRQAAAYWGHIRLVELLLSHGADPNYTDELGGSALYRAEKRGFKRCKDVLLRAGAKLSLSERGERRE